MYLLDTHTFVWSLSDDKRLSEIAKEILSQRNNVIFVSSISFYELAFKNNLGKWPEVDIIVKNASQLMNKMQYRPLNLSIEHSLAAAVLPLNHRDPFDRFLVAQSKIENYPLISKDK
ncbi:MAG TPA: type II toxin-antitoxin system VapC family toxin, partial [Trueperaceae bacterium]|nr:type II toxin-antitoxin system VapC family toxin [Trueperaceae bacterium]